MSQSGRTAYRLQARPASMGPHLQLTAIQSSLLPFNGCHHRNPCNYMNHYSFTDPGGMEDDKHDDKNATKCLTLSSVLSNSSWPRTSSASRMCCFTSSSSDAALTRELDKLDSNSLPHVPAVRYYNFYTSQLFDNPATIREQIPP